LTVNFRIGEREISVRETIPDRIIKYFNPVKARERMQARIMMALAGGYVGGSRSRRSMSGWIPSTGDADADILYDLPVLRGRSRDLARNNPLATGALNTTVTNVVGTGLKLQARIDRDVLNLTEEEADAWEARAEREWRLWAESQECDATRTLTFADMQELAFRQVLENGDVFFLLPRLKRGNFPYMLRLQAVEADRVCNEDNKPDSDRLSGGVEKDKYGAPVAYHIAKRHPGRIFGSVKQEWVVVKAFGEKTGLRNVIHLFRQLRPGQSRGVPYLAPVIEALKQISRYTEAELMAAVVSGMFTVFIETATGDGELAPMAPTDDIGGSDTDEDYKLGNGAIVGLAPGEKISAANPGRPNTAFDPFVLAVLRQIGVALELPFEVLVKHFTASYSAARAALLEAWKFFNSRRQWLAKNFCQIVYEHFIYEAVALGRLDAPGFFDDPMISKAYCGAEWIGPAKGMIDELKEVKAAREKIDMGVATISEVTAELTGGDWEKKHRQSAKEMRMRREAGLVVDKADSGALSEKEVLNETD